MVLRCSRCSRYGTATSSIGDDTPPLDYVVVLGTDDGAWASIGGQDVCPQCQTDEERQEVRRRLSDAIRGMVDQRVAADAPPDDIEAGLIGFAMSIGDEADADEHVTDEHASRSTAQARTSAEPRQVSVAVTGAFLTGRPLLVDIDNYEGLQRRLATRLREPHWRTDGLQSGGGTYESGGGFTTPLPLVMIRRDGADLLPWLAPPLSNFRPGTGEGQPKGPLLSAKARSLEVDIYDLGVAVLLVWLDVNTDPTAPLPEVARAINDLVRLRPARDGEHPPLGSVLQRIVSGTTREYADAVSAVASRRTQRAWLMPLRSGKDTGAAPADAPDHGRLLWLHPIDVLHTPGAAKQTVKELAPTFRKICRLEGGSFAAGIGWSAVATDRADGTAVNDAVQLSQLHWAYFALYAGIDRGLLKTLGNQEHDKPVKLKKLEDEAEDVFANYLRIQQARARLDSHLAEIGGDQVTTWKVISRVQRFDAISDAVDEKVRTLRRLAQRRVEQASETRDRWVSNVLGALAALTLITVTTAVIAALSGEPPRGASGIWRWWVVWPAVALAIVVALLVTFWRRIRRHRARSPSSLGG